MNLLAIESSTAHLSVALACGGEIISRECDAGQRHSELALPMVEALLVDAGIARDALDALAFGAGPGSFTGVRIACGIAQGLAFGLGVLVVAVPTLLALADDAGGERVIAVLDARMGEIYHAAYVRGAGGWLAAVAPCLCKPGNAPAVPGSGWTGAGSGFAAFAEVLGERYSGQLHRTRPELVPRAAAVARLARDGFAGREFVPAEQAAPLYLRDKVALTMREQQAAR